MEEYHKQHQTSTNSVIAKQLEKMGIHKFSLRELNSISNLNLDCASMNNLVESQITPKNVRLKRKLSNDYTFFHQN